MTLVKVWRCFGALVFVFVSVLPPGALFIGNRAWGAECGSVVSDSCDPRLLCPWVRVSGLPFPSPGYLPDPGIELGSCDPMDCSLPGSSCVAGGFFTELGGKPGGTSGAGFPLPRAPLRGLVGA